MTTLKTSSYIRTTGGILGLLFSLAACHDDTVYHTYQNLSSNGWNKQDTLEYTLPSQLAGHTYELEVGLRHTENYPYQDIWLEVLYPLSPDRRPDTLHLSLADKWGNWKGKGTAGNMYQFTCTQDHPLHLSRADSLLQVVHIMRDKSLKGISDVGMRLSTFTGSVNTQKNKQ